jgi:hypothetical protein
MIQIGEVPYSIGDALISGNGRLLSVVFAATQLSLRLMLREHRVAFWRGIQGVQRL